MQEKYELIGDVRGKGLFIGVELVKDRKTKKPAKEEAHEVIFQCFKKGLAIITAGLSTIRIAPPLVITEELMDIGLEIFEEILRNVNSG
jgi:4-aminobutyrate aminotransferase-like enzyme